MAAKITRGEVLEKLRALLEARFSLPAHSLGETVRLRDLNVDSMHIVELMLDLEDMLQIKISSLSLPKNPTLAAVADAIAGAL